MPRVVGIKFQGTAKVYWFDAGEFSYAENESVIVETAKGLEIGVVKSLPKEVDEKDIVAPLKAVVRIATQADLDRLADQQRRIPEIIQTAQEKVTNRKIDMKVVDAQFTVDGSKLTLYFTAENRVDFRDLVKDLASAFRTRIDLRQIGERDECKMKGGLGTCGRKLCCASGCDFTKVNIKMAKNQNLSLNPQKISGVCNRLMCCLAYENEGYVEANKLLPKIGSTVKVRSVNKGTVLSTNPLKRTVRVRVEFGSGDGVEVEEVPMEEVEKIAE